MKITKNKINNDNSIKIYLKLVLKLLFFFISTEQNMIPFCRERKI